MRELDVLGRDLHADLLDSLAHERLDDRFLCFEVPRRRVERSVGLSGARSPAEQDPALLVSDQKVHITDDGVPFRAGDSHFWSLSRCARPEREHDHKPSVDSALPDDPQLEVPSNVGPRDPLSR
ncbi:hypothetical protein [Nocardia sp. NPDC057227]|uniref:hypothetical protein n=1 Tax=Nocardia sp. NPDC057227 TaxID=3346056 RepID=UPI00362E023E